MDLSPRPHPPSPATSPVLLVDGDNLSRDHAADILRAARRLGEPLVRRVYGSIAAISGWEEFGFRLCPTRPGKNAADMLLCVEAMLLALRDGAGTLVIASSDRDFTYLAEHLRENGKRVEGVGGVNTPESFRSACASFTLLLEPADRAARPTFLRHGDKPAASAPAPAPAKTPAKPAAPPAGAALAQPSSFIPRIRDHLAQSNRPGNQGTLGWIGHCLRLGAPGFDPAAYGKPSLEAFLRGLNYFVFTTSETGEVMIRDPHPKPPSSRPHPVVPQPAPAQPLGAPAP